MYVLLKCHMHYRTLLPACCEQLSLQFSWVYSYRHFASVYILSIRRNQVQAEARWWSSGFKAHTPQYKVWDTWDWEIFLNSVSYLTRSLNQWKINMIVYFLNIFMVILSEETSFWSVVSDRYRPILLTMIGDRPKKSWLNPCQKYKPQPDCNHVQWKRETGTI